MARSENHCSRADAALPLSVGLSLATVGGGAGGLLVLVAVYFFVVLVVLPFFVLVVVCIIRRQRFADPAVAAGAAAEARAQLDQLKNAARNHQRHDEQRAHAAQS